MPEDAVKTAGLAELIRVLALAVVEEEEKAPPEDVTTARPRYRERLNDGQVNKAKPS